MAMEETTEDGARARRRTAGRAAAMALGACGAAATALLLGACAHGLASDPAPLQVDVAVEATVVGIGALVAAWMAACAALAAVCLALRVVGASWRAGERTVHRFAPVVVRRALAVAVVGGLGAGLAPGAYATDAPAPASTGASVEVVERGIDLGWVVTSGRDTPAADSRAHDEAGEQVAGAAVASRAAAPRADHGVVARNSPAPPGAGTTPGGTVAVGAVPGSAVPAGAGPGGTVPGSAVPGGTVPGRTVPGGTVSDGAVRSGVDRADAGETARVAAADPEGADAGPGRVGEHDAPPSAAVGHPVDAAGTTVGRRAAGVATPGAFPDLSGAPAARAATVVVHRGDSLWRIAARHLPPGSDDAAIAAAWPAWYAANRATIGDDPGMLLPGQVLAVPAEVAP